MEPRARRPAPRRRVEQPAERTALGWRRGRWRGRWWSGRWWRPGRWRTGRRTQPGAGGPDPPVAGPGGAEHATRSHRSPAPRRRAGGEGLVIAAFWLLIALQGPQGVDGAAPDVTARVDRVRLTAGEQLLLTVRARTRSAE